MDRISVLVAVCALLTGPVRAGQPGGGNGPGGGGRAGAERWPDKLNEGDNAPDFTLQSPDEKFSFALSSFKGKKPVVLVFGSYT